MSRTITTVSDLWREYEEGIGGRPSVRSVYEAKKYKFSDDSERRHYQRRLIIINGVKMLAEREAVPERAIARMLDGVMSKEKMSLNKLQKQIKDGLLEDI